MKNAAGVHIEDAWVPFGFAAVNLIASIVLAQKFGVFGVILGSIIGSLLTADWYRPIIIFKKVFRCSSFHYFKKYILYILLGIGYMAVATILCEYIKFSNILVAFILRCIICLILPNLITIILFHRTSEFKYLYNIAIVFINKLKNKIHR